MIKTQYLKPIKNFSKIVMAASVAIIAHLHFSKSKDLLPEEKPDKITQILKFMIGDFCDPETAVSKKQASDQPKELLAAKKGHIANLERLDALGNLH